MALMLDVCGNTCDIRELWPAPDVSDCAYSIVASGTDQQITCPFYGDKCESETSIKRIHALSVPLAQRRNLILFECTI